MEKYIKENKAAWEEAFDHREASWGADIVKRVENEDFPFFYEETRETLKRLPLEGAVIGQFCCNNGRELLSLVKCGKASKGIGFDIAENQIAFAREKAGELRLPCDFEAVNIYDIDDTYKEVFDVVLITIGALCWFEDLQRFFEVVSRCMKPGAFLVISEQHPFTNMLATEGEEEYNADHQTECRYNYFRYKWIGNEGIYYMTKKRYPSRTFTDFSHPLSEIISGICDNGIDVTGFKEFDYDISGMFESLNGKGVPLSMLITGRKS